MKAKLYVLLGLCILFVACKKNNGSYTGNSAIKGTWELRATRNGNIMPATYAPGNGNQLSFSDVVFDRYTAGSIVAKGTYGKTTNTSNQYNIFLDNGNGTSTNEGAILQKDTLELFPVNPDAATGFYVKTSDNPLTN